MYRTEYAIVEFPLHNAIENLTIQGRALELYSILTNVVVWPSND